MGNTKFDWAWACNNAPAWTNEQQGYFTHCVDCLRAAAALENGNTGIYQSNKIGNLMASAFKAFQMAGYRYNTTPELVSKFGELVTATFNGEI